MHPILVNVKQPFQQRINWVWGSIGLLIYTFFMLPLVIVRNTDYQSEHHWELTAAGALMLGIFMGVDGVESLRCPFAWTLPNHRKYVRASLFILGLIHCFILSFVFWAFTSPPQRPCQLGFLGIGCFTLALISIGMMFIALVNLNEIYFLLCIAIALLGPYIYSTLGVTDVVPGWMLISASICMILVCWWVWGRPALARGLVSKVPVHLIGGYGERKECQWWIRLFENVRRLLDPPLTSSSLLLDSMNRCTPYGFKRHLLGSLYMRYSHLAMAWYTVLVLILVTASFFGYSQPENVRFWAALLVIGFVLSCEPGRHNLLLPISSHHRFFSSLIAPIIMLGGLYLFLLIITVLTSLLSPIMPDLNKWHFHPVHGGIVWVPMIAVPAALGVSFIIRRCPIWGVFLCYGLVVFIIFANASFWFEGDTEFSAAVLPCLVTSSILWLVYILVLGFYCYRGSPVKI